MTKLKINVLELDRVPTLEELKMIFRENDWTTHKVYDDDELTPEMNEDIAHMKKLINEKFDPLAKEMGRKKHPSCYSKDHPLMKLQDGAGDVIAKYTEKLMLERPDNAEKILEDFGLFTDPDVHEKADKFLNNAIETMLQVMSYPEIAEITEGTLSHSDFSNIPVNNPKVDFLKQWNQYSDKYDVLSFDELSDSELDEKTEEAEANRELLTEAVGLFWNALSDEEKLIVNYRIDGWDYDDIAYEMGYKSHSAIVKKRQKIEAKFREYLKDEYNFT